MQPSETAISQPSESAVARPIMVQTALQEIMDRAFNTADNDNAGTDGGYHFTRLVVDYDSEDSLDDVDNITEKSYNAFVHQPNKLEESDPCILARIIRFANDSNENVDFLIRTIEFKEM